MKFKKLCAAIVSLSLAGTLAAIPAMAKEPVSVRYNLPESIKIGETLPASMGEYECIAYFDHLDPSQPGIYYHTADEQDLYSMFYPSHLGEGPYASIDENGTAQAIIMFTPEYQTAYAPGKLSFDFAYAYGDGSWDDAPSEDEYISVGEPFTVTVEEPVIETNAPEYVKAGSTLRFTTELTNTALENRDTAYYLDENNYDENGWLKMDSSNFDLLHKIAYLPCVEVVEGQEIVKQSEQDYSNTLHSAETLTFTGTGTVTLKVTYKQFATCWSCNSVFVSEGNPTGEYRTYNPETLITLHVTEDGIAPAPETDKEELEQIITEYSDLSAADYTAESFAAYEAAFKQAKAVFENPDATQEQVDAAMTALKRAVTQLKPAGTSGTDPEEGDEETEPSDTNDDQEETESPDTGDENVFTGAILLTCAALGGGSLIMYRRKRSS